MSKENKSLILFVVTFLFLNSCEKSNFDNTPKYLVTAKVIIPGLRCKNGGALVVEGKDGVEGFQVNGILQKNEIESSHAVCSGESTGNKYNALFEQLLEQPGDHCESGGLRYDVGIDKNKNSVLDLNEVTDSEFKCYPSAELSANIIYQSDINFSEMHDIYQTLADKKNPSKLYQPYSYEGVNNFFISPDKSQLLIRSYELIEGVHFDPKNATYLRSLYTVSLTEPSAVILLDSYPEFTSSDIQPIWSADSNYIYYVNFPDKELFVPEVYSIKFDGTNKVSLSGALTEVYEPVKMQLSPDGEYLAFIAETKEYRLFHELYTININSRELTKVSKDIDLYDYWGARNFLWSPDSEKIAFEHSGRLYTVEPDGGSLTLMTEMHATLYSGLSDYQYRWSPDGRYLAFSAKDDDFSEFELYTTNPDATETIQVSLAQDPFYNPREC